MERGAGGSLPKSRVQTRIKKRLPQIGQRQTTPTMAPRGEPTDGREPGGTGTSSGTVHTEARPGSRSSAALRSTLGIVLDGAVVTMVVPGGPAWRATKDGLRIEEGDVVRAVDGREISRESASAAMRGSDLPGTPVRIQVEKTAQSKWTKLDGSLLPPDHGQVVEFVLVRQDIETVSLLKNVQAAFSHTWKAVGDGVRVEHSLEDLERCVDALVVHASEDDARMHQAVRELERKSGLTAGGEMQEADIAMLGQQAAVEVGQARQRIRTLEMQLGMLNNEVESSREEERRARAAALEAQEVFRRNDADLRAELESLQEGMVRMDRRVRDESGRADEERERADRLTEEVRILRSNNEAMQSELVRYDAIKNKSAKQSSEAVALALREVLLVQDELSDAKKEVEQLKEGEHLMTERLRVIETARDTVDQGDGHRDEQLKTLRAEIVFLRKTIEAVKDERSKMREHVAKQAREIVVLDNQLAEKVTADGQELQKTKDTLFKTKNALRLREAQVLALEEELRRQTQQQAPREKGPEGLNEKTKAASPIPLFADEESRQRSSELPLFNTRVDEIPKVCMFALLTSFVFMIAKSMETLGKSPMLSLVVITSGLFFWVLICLASFKCTIWVLRRMKSGQSPSVVTSLPETLPLINASADGYQPISDQTRLGARSRKTYQATNDIAPPSNGGAPSDRDNSLRNPDFFSSRAKSPALSTYTPLTMDVQNGGLEEPQSAYEATQKYLSMTSGRPLSYSEPYQAQAWESKDFSRAVDKDLRDLEASAPVTLLTSRSSVNSGQTSRRSREERLASLQGTVQRQGDLSMA